MPRVISQYLERRYRTYVIIQLIKGDGILKHEQRKRSPWQFENIWKSRF